MTTKKEKKTAQIPNRKKAHASYKLHCQQYEIVIRKLYQKVRNLLIKRGINATIKYRIKTFESYYEKLLQLYDSTADHFKLTDILGIRIICPFLEDLDDVEKLITQNFSVIEIEIKGSKHSLMEFAYDSTHMLIELPPNSLKSGIVHTKKVCEIQLRTILQDAWAEVEHELIYKAGFSLLNEPIRRKLASLNATLTLSDIIFQEIRDYQKEIQLRGEKRRESLNEKVQIIDQISIPSPVEDPDFFRNDDTLTIPMKPKSKLEGLIFKALDAHSKNKYVQAISIYSRILSMNLNKQVRSIIYNHRGMAYFIQSDYKRSIRDFTRAIDFNNENFRAINNRGLTYRIMHQYEHALKDFGNSLKINSFQVECFYSRALTYNDLYDFTRALEDCGNALNINPDFLPAKRLKNIIEMKIFN